MVCPEETHMGWPTIYTKENATDSWMKKLDEDCTLPVRHTSAWNLLLSFPFAPWCATAMVFRNDVYSSEGLTHREIWLTMGLTGRDGGFTAWVGRPYRLDATRQRGQWGGLLSLAQALRNRCERMAELQGERLRA